MGIDVFGVFQKKEDESWVTVSEYYSGRRDWLEDWLGLPFGCRYTPYPISVPRGLPVDFDRENIHVGEGWQSWLSADEILNALPVLGTETHQVFIEIYFEAWERTKEFSLAEWEFFIEDTDLLSLEEWHGILNNVGINKYLEHINLKHELRALKKRINDPYAIDVKLVAVAPQNYDHKFTADYGLVDCVYDLSDSLKYFTDEVRLLKEKYGNIRFVFGFS